MIITLMGEPCSGKSSAAQLLASHYGFKHYSMGDLRRKMATDRGLTLAELNKLGEGEEDTDTAVDEYQRTLGVTEDDFVVDGRMSAKMIPRAIKIYLTADEDVRARRMVQDPRHHRMGEPIYEEEKAKAVMKARVESDKTRFQRHYHYNPYHANNYDIVVDTSNLTLEEVKNELIRRIDAKKDLKGKSGSSGTTEAHR